jgi:hypothetical protein
MNSSLSQYDVNVDAINVCIREDISKVLSGDKNCLNIRGIHNFNYYINIIREMVGDEDGIEIEDFNGWKMDFYHEFIFNKKDFVFYGCVFDNTYTIERHS